MRPPARDCSSALRNSLRCVPSILYLRSAGGRAPETNAPRAIPPCARIGLDKGRKARAVRAAPPAPSARAVPPVLPDRLTIVPARPPSPLGRALVARRPCRGSVLPRLVRHPAPGARPPLRRGRGTLLGANRCARPRRGCRHSRLRAAARPPRGHARCLTPRVPPAVMRSEASRPARAPRRAAVYDRRRR
jgi:hypothetical protein